MFWGKSGKTGYVLIDIVEVCLLVGLWGQSVVGLTAIGNPELGQPRFAYSQAEVAAARCSHVA